MVLDHKETESEAAEDKGAAKDGDGGEGVQDKGKDDDSKKKEEEENPENKKESDQNEDTPRGEEPQKVTLDVEPEELGNHAETKPDSKIEETKKIIGEDSKDADSKDSNSSAKSKLENEKPIEKKRQQSDAIVLKNVSLPPRRAGHGSKLNAPV